jgi:hypothetical protein
MPSSQGGSTATMLVNVEPSVLGKVGSMESKDPTNGAASLILSFKSSKEDPRLGPAVCTCCGSADAASAVHATTANSNITGDTCKYDLTLIGVPVFLMFSCLYQDIYKPSRCIVIVVLLQVVQMSLEHTVTCVHLWVLCITPELCNSLTPYRVTPATTLQFCDYAHIQACASGKALFQPVLLYLYK